MEEKTRLFRKTAFGGFHRDDVMRYIEEKKREFADYKAEVEATVRALEEKLAQLEANRPAAADEAKAPGNSAADLNETAERLKAVADALTGSLNRLIDRFAADSPAAEEPKEKEPEDFVTVVLENLCTAPAPAPQPKTAPPLTLDDVLPGYLSK
ncbi:MAG: hypothetical protein IJL52_00160 [Clostridia bacterium]|nr:hypothetical protein [Clostridia bacterium]